MNKYLLIILTTISTTVSVYAQQTGEVFQFPDGSYCAAIKSDVFQYYAARQEYDNWCWAACIQMVLNYQGIKVSQDRIVIKAFGQLVNRGADCYVMTNAANGWNYNGTVIEAWQENSPSASDLIDALAYKYPVIIGLNMPGQNMGHAYVLTAIYYTRNSNGTKIPYKVVLRDPWPSNPSRTDLSWTNFVNRINCIVHITH